MLWYILQHDDPNLSTAWYHPEDRRFLRRQSPASPRPFEPVAPSFSAPDTGRSALMPGDYIPFITRHLAFPTNRWAPVDDAATPQARHLLNLTVVDIQFVGDWPVRPIQAHQIQTHEPHASRLMMASKNRRRQIIERLSTLFTAITSAGLMTVIPASLGDLVGLTMRASNPIGPTPMANFLVTLLIINPMMEV